MSKELSMMYQRLRRVEEKGKITNKNKASVINSLNKVTRDYDFPKLTSKSTANDIKLVKNLYIEKLGTDIMTMAIQEGNNITASLVADSLLKSKDDYTKRLAKYGERLANAKRESSVKFTKDEKEYLEGGNGNILGYGNLSMIELFEKTKNDKEAMSLINTVKNQNIKDVFIDKHLTTIEKIFRKVEITREDDLNKLKEYLKGKGVIEIGQIGQGLEKSLEIYPSGQVAVGSSADEEQELGNARLTDLMKRLGLDENTQTKISKSENNKVLKKYKVNKNK